MRTIVYLPEPREIELRGNLATELFTWLESLQGHCHRARPILICKQCRGALYLRHARNQPHELNVVHFSRGDCQDLRITHAGMSPEHEHEAEYYARAAEHVGYHATLEVPTIARTIVDVVIEGGSVTTGLEVQLSHLKVASARLRTKRTMSAGLTVAWSANTPQPPLWYDQVPSFRPTMRMWQNVPPPRSVGIAGPVSITPVRCEVGAFAKCPDGHRRPCRQYHPRTSPWLGLLADDVATLIPAGEMVPLQLRNAVKLVSQDDARLYEELTGNPAAFTPAMPPPQPDKQPAGYFECTRPPAIPGPTATEPDELLELWPDTQEAILTAPSRPRWRPPPAGAIAPGMCPGCQTVRLPRGRDTCQACSLAIIMSRRRPQN